MTLSDVQATILINIREWQSKQKYSILSKDDGQYLAFNSGNGKIFYSANFDPNGEIYFGIREDGNTRTVFNGKIESFEDFLRIDQLTQ